MISPRGLLLTVPSVNQGRVGRVGWVGWGGRERKRPGRAGVRKVGQDQSMKGNEARSSDSYALGWFQWPFSLEQVIGRVSWQGVAMRKNTLVSASVCVCGVRVFHSRWHFCVKCLAWPSTQSVIRNGCLYVGAVATVAWLSSFVWRIWLLFHVTTICLCYGRCCCDSRLALTFCVKSLAWPSTQSFIPRNGCLSVPRCFGDFQDSAAIDDKFRHHLLRCQYPMRWYYHEFFLFLLLVETKSKKRTFLFVSVLASLSSCAHFPGCCYW